MVDERRVRTLNDQAVADSGPVLYVMGREQRVQDNWALLYAKEQATAASVPLVVAFVVGPMFLSGTARHNHWLVASLKDVANGLATYNIPFTVRTGDWVETVLACQREYQAGQLVFDCNPLEPIRSWRDQAAARLPVRVTEVDARNVVPVWQASDKEEFAAYTLRPKIHQQLADFLVPFPQLSKQSETYAVPEIDWGAVASYRTWDGEAPVPSWLTPGETAAQTVLEAFMSDRLNGYADGRNDPNQDHLSHLSPYLRWGNIAAARVALEVKSKRGVRREDKEAFLEELIVRRELADNFVFYNRHYNRVAGAHAWAQQTIKEHADDPREWLYSYQELEQGKTHDELWNAAQRQMVTEGKMHGYLRMYWAKKILEWTPDAQTAIDWALALNDAYELDGRDSNGVVGVMWSICGVHDRAWTERPIFGKIRYMNYNGAKRKFDVAAFVDRYQPQTRLFDD